MKNKAHDIASYSFQKGEQLLLDTNVWLCICPVPSDTSKIYTAGYVAAFKKMLTAGCCLVMECWKELTMLAPRLLGGFGDIR